ncbi:acetyltransferase [Laribacter hongkongensis]|uniref:acetyltransferase n=1 Tax=Laribacter hongkongensis TaxID=168471 RepID=UPI001EFDF0DD|nr:acetyltransferase [Laribacter hongkongensis]MCG8995495.1 acetyltransferase [Laribacter hongkongensis]MCG9010312.1 acetyltransferase [Laribacter hongkongensis]MCG9046206.1 acetyltransferase [Laribacter hongkongensis]MCG9051747.1 acetyltransferase [Laribacter hongkongensis]MCG9073778.1 acetyltransferase [Laribacter hongkongensis]
MTRSPILLVGAGGHALACLDVIQANGRFNIKGLIGSAAEVDQQRLAYPIIGSDEDLPRLARAGANALVCVGQIKSPDLRIGLFEQLRRLGFGLPTIISPTAWVSPHAKVGAGSIVMHGAIVNADAQIGENCIINTRALVEHGSRVADHCHVSTGAILNGDVVVGEGSFIGSGSLIKNGVQVGRRCIVGMGTSVSRNLADGALLKRAG